VRVLFDEQMSSYVARALELLDKDVQHVGGQGQPPKGSDDPLVVQIAHRQQRLIFTQNFDMVIAAADSEARFIWFETHGKNDLTRFETAWLFFRRWNSWEALADRDLVDCLRVTRTTTAAMSFPEARGKAQRRMDRSARFKSPSRRRQPRRNQLSFDVDS
jgi:hypothetical protein